jgi:Arc/MetJ-type ribon-helix-helix transcriptional regulator
MIKNNEPRRTTVHLTKQHEDLLDYIVLTMRRQHRLRISKSDVIRRGIEMIARLTDAERLDILG